jgi:anti-sigma factor RsiW
MSIPSDLLDQLLTGYLDDVLSSDERARVESLVQSDHQVAGQLADLREMQALLRSIAAADSSIQLDSGFADRVLGAAVDRARTEGLSEDHPLVRLTDQPSVSHLSKSDSHPFRYAAILVGLAASIAIAVVMLRPDSSDGDVPLASVDVESPGDVVTADLVAEERVPAIDSIVTIDPPEIPASNITASNRPESETAEIVDQPPAVSPAAVAKAAVPDMQIANSDAPNRANFAEPARLQLGAILVLDVRLTAAGQMKNAIQSSMQKAGLDRTDEKELPQELAGQFGAADYDAPTGQVTVMYLQASAKTLDRFYLSLLGDQVGVESVGMSLAMDAPILKVVQSLATDPTTVRHDKTALELSSSAGVVGQLAGELSQLSFAPLNRQNAGALSPSGPDEPAQILLLVR